MSFQPTQVPGCQVWLDGADPNATGIAPANGATISSWKDKSGNARNATATGTSTYAVNLQNGLGAPNLNTTTVYFTTPGFIPATNGDPSIFIVVKQTSYGGSGNSDFFYDTVSYLYFDLFGKDTQFSARLDIYGNPNELVIGSISSAALITVIGSTNFVGTAYYNGNGRGSLTGGNPYNLNTSRSFYIGNGPGFVGYVFEVIVYNQALPTPQRQQVEGYLAWKWGLQASLPNSHPYFYFPPNAIQPTTEVSLINTTSNAGTITLPSVSSLLGRILTFKDSQGTWARSTLTLSTAGIFDKFEDNTNTKIFLERFGATTLFGGDNNRWYVVGGTQITMGNVSSTTANTTNTPFVSSASISLSTLNVFGATTNQTSTIFLSSSLLYWGSNIWGGTKTAIPLTLATPRFSPTQLPSLSLWLDAADSTTVTIAAGPYVSKWTDKASSIPFNITSNTNSSYANNLINIFGGSFFLNGSGSIATNQVYTHFIVLSNAGGATQSVLSLSPSSGNAFILNQCPWVTTSVRHLYRVPPGNTGGVNASNAVPANPVPLLMLTYYRRATNPNYELGVLTNGGNLGTAVDTQSAAVAASGFIGVGAFPGGGASTFPMTGAFGEILFYNAELTTPQRQQVEGYLAWKWGLQTFLPTTHPYYYGPP